MTKRTFGRNDGGYVLVTVALMLVVLVSLAGFAVDLGTWYVKATKLQRAADVAALSAASSLPNEAQAISVAQSTLQRNGLSATGSVTFDIDVEGGVVNVSVRDSAVPTYFTKMFLSKVDIERSSRAEKRSVIPLGSPFNAVGGGTVVSGLQNQNFWASINGMCAPAEDGDLFASKWNYNKYRSSETNDCNPSALKRNPNYIAPEGTGFNGYSYMIEVPAGVTGRINIDIWNPAYGNNSGQDASFKLANTPSRNDMNTTYSLYRSNAEGAEVGLPISSQQFADGASPGATWFTMQEPSGSTGKRFYKLKVWNDWTFLDTRYGVDANNYSVIAYSGTRQACDSRLTPNTCPKVYGLGALSVMNNLANGKPEFFLAEISPAFVGSTIEVYLWDPAEGAESIELVSPNGTAVPFTWSVTPTTGLAQSASTTPVTSLDVSGEGPQPHPDTYEKGKYNSRLVTLRFTLDTYAGLQSGNGDYWWKLRYTVGNDVKTDRITYGVKASAASPVHLTR